MSDVLKGLSPEMRAGLEEDERRVRALVEAQFAKKVEGLSEEEARALLQREMDEVEAERARIERAWDEAHGIPPSAAPGPGDGGQASPRLATPATPPQLRASLHALWRARQRLGAQEDWQVYLWASRALEQGLALEHTTGALRLFLEGRRARRGGLFRVLGGLVAVFNDTADELITVLALPGDLRNTAKAQEARHRPPPSKK
jgi:hypothetical protein